MHVLQWVYLACILYGSLVLVDVSKANKNWWKFTQIYEVYIRSFKDSDGDGIGDLKGGCTCCILYVCVRVFIARCRNSFICRPGGK